MTAGLPEPVPRALGRVLRDLVLIEAGRSGREDRSRATLHVGIPGQAGRELPLAACGEGDLDHALRVEIIEAMAVDALHRGRVPLVWLTRAPTGPDMDDLAWAASVSAAGAEMGVRLDMVVVTRTSWTDPRSGAGRTWRRLRRPPEGSRP